MSFPPSSAIDYATELYIGYFNRAPDPVGLNFWINGYNNDVAFFTAHPNGANGIPGIGAGYDAPSWTLGQLGIGMAQSTETTTLYPYLLTPNAAGAQQFVTSIFANLLNRAPDAGGLAYWTGKLTGGEPAGQVIADILSVINIESPTSPDVMTLTNKITVAEDFVTQSTAVSISASSFQINETDNHLTTVTITGSNSLYLGENTDTSHGAGPNNNDGVVTDSGIAAATSPTTTASSLHLIDASATTGGVHIFAGASNVAGATYHDGTVLSANNTITYTGLTIKGGSGQDYIYNDANNGVVIEGNHNNDLISLGGSGASATFGSGASDIGWVGVQFIGNTSEIGTPEPAGTAIGDTFTFGAAATATLKVGVGAEAGSSAATLSIGQTAVNGAVAGMKLDFMQVIITTGTIYVNTSAVNENAAVASKSNLTDAEHAAASALGKAGVAYFDYGGNEYVIAVHTTESGVSSADAIVELVGITNHTMTCTGSLVTLA
jgi:Domain of unknown function (DUF4214)